MKEDSYILISLYRLVTELDRETGRISASHGITYSQFAVLEALYHKGEMTVGEVKEAILSSDGTIPVIVTNLEKQNLVRRYQDPRDRRRSIVQLTDKGRALIAQAYPENEDMFTRKFSVWSRDEKRELIRLLKKYREEHGS